MPINFDNVSIIYYFFTGALAFNSKSESFFSAHLQRVKGGKSVVSDVSELTHFVFLSSQYMN